MKSLNRPVLIEVMSKMSLKFVYLIAWSLEYNDQMPRIKNKPGWKLTVLFTLTESWPVLLTHTYLQVIRKINLDADDMGAVCNIMNNYEVVKLF